VIVDLTTLTAIQRDALREVGSIGAGHAATALSQLVDHPVSLEVPTVEVIPIKDVPRIFGGPERLAIAVYTRLVGDLSGGILFMAEQEAALAFVDMLRGRPVGTTVSQTVENGALLTHAASLLIAAYLAAIARMADVHVIPAEPAYACDMAGAILEVVYAEAGIYAEEAITLRTALVDQTFTADVALFFLPDPESLAVLLGRLGLV
jgi:chemotaxis protein CheC